MKLKRLEAAFCWNIKMNSIHNNYIINDSIKTKIRIKFWYSEKVITQFSFFRWKYFFKLFYFSLRVDIFEEAGASDVGGNICSSLTLTFGCYGSPSFLKNKVKIKLGYH